MKLRLGFKNRQDDEKYGRSENVKIKQNLNDLIFLISTYMGGIIVSIIPKTNNIMNQPKITKVKYNPFNMAEEILRDYLEKLDNAMT